MKQINVKVVNGISGEDCDVKMPIDATVCELIEGLVNTGFLASDYLYASYVLHDLGVTSGIKYDDYSKTVKEYGWQNGQVFVAISESVAGQ